MPLVLSLLTFSTSPFLEQILENSAQSVGVIGRFFYNDLLLSTRSDPSKQVCKNALFKHYPC